MTLQGDVVSALHLYAERGSPKFERAALRWLERYLTEVFPQPRDIGEMRGAAVWPVRPSPQFSVEDAVPRLREPAEARIIHADGNADETPHGCARR